jgi:hypothetical protein
MQPTRQKIGPNGKSKIAIRCSPPFRLSAVVIAKTAAIRE